MTTTWHSLAGSLISLQHLDTPDSGNQNEDVVFPYHGGMAPTLAQLWVGSAFPHSERGPVVSIYGCAEFAWQHAS